MEGLQYYPMFISAALAAGVGVALYPAFLQSIVISFVLVASLLYRVLMWAEKNKIDGYLKSLVAASCAILGLIYLSKGGMFFLTLSTLYLFLSVIMMYLNINYIELEWPVKSKRQKNS